jgi:hypothetical protein
MATKLNRNWRVWQKVFFLLLLVCFARIAAGATDEKIILKVVGPDG